MQVRLIILITVLLTACAPQKTLTAELQPRLLRADNLEETVSRRDELMMAYSLTSYDAKNQPVGVVNGGWGVQTIQKGEQIDLQTAGPQQAQAIRLPMPRGGKIVASLVLIEIDDYDRAKALLDQVRRVHNVVAGPAALLLTTAEALTPLKYVAAGLAASGVGLKLVDQFDDDDLLGQTSVEVSDASVRQNNRQIIHVPAVFTGRNLRDQFAYRLEYDVRLKIAKIRSFRQ